mmetsp:Transcript_70630/g.133215  ORF Transcript_70630/g.133215 Transcript_70630/m.133215 type:complete len:300 (+) Transcript_70630:645-1544(+)
MPSLLRVLQVHPQCWLVRTLYGVRGDAALALVCMDLLTCMLAKARAPSKPQRPRLCLTSAFEHSLSHGPQRRAELGVCITLRNCDDPRWCRLLPAKLLVCILIRCRHRPPPEEHWNEHVLLFGHAWLQQNLQGNDIVICLDDTHRLFAFEEGVDSVPECIHEGKGRVPITWGPAQHLESFGFELLEGGVGRHFRCELAPRLLWKISRQQRKGNRMWRLWDGYGEIHGRVEGHADVATDGALQLRAQLKLEEVHDRGIVALLVDCPELFRHLHIWPPRFILGFQRLPRVRRSVCILMQAV